MVDVELGLREDQFEWCLEPASGAIEVEILEREFLGSRWRYIVSASGVVFSMVSAVQIEASVTTMWLKPSGGAACFRDGHRLA